MENVNACKYLTYDPAQKWYKFVRVDYAVCTCDKLIHPVSVPWCISIDFQRFRVKFLSFSHYKYFKNLVSVTFYSEQITCGHAIW